MVGITKLRPASESEIESLQILLSADLDNKVGSVRNGSDVLGETVFVIVHSESLAGFCTYRSAADEIFPLVVFHAFRRKGVGKEAMRQLLDILRSEGVEEVGIEALPGAESFWQSVFEGFQGRSYGGGKYTFNI